MEPNLKLKEQKLPMVMVAMEHCLDETNAGNL
jgi:hypothetical protein